MEERDWGKDGTILGGSSVDSGKEVLGMNSRDRVFAALIRKEPDRVRTFEWDIDQGVIEALCPGCSDFDFIEAMDLDGVCVSPNYQVEKIGEDRYRDEWGVVRAKGREVYLFPIEDRAPIKSRQDLRGYVAPDPFRPGRFDKLLQAVERFKGKKAIIMKIRDAFSTPRDLRGYTGLLMDIIEDPELVQDLVQLSIEHAIHIGREAIKLGAEIVVTGDDYANNLGPLMSPKHFRDIFLPGIRKLVHEMKDSGAYFIKHTDGNVMSLIDMFIEAGIDCIDPIDPVAGMNIVEVKTRYGTRVALKGNIDCARTLSFRSTGEVVQEVKECITKVSPGGGHIISSSNSIHSGVKPENYKAMLDAIREYGEYPISVD